MIIFYNKLNEVVFIYVFVVENILDYEFENKLFLYYNCS